MSDATDGDLIDTLWNVKEHTREDYTLFCIGFNRYIVECKATNLSYNSPFEIKDLIDTLWNVKMLDGLTPVIAGTEI